MSKLLNLQYNGTPVALALEKVDRAKLYGFTDIEVQDDEGRPCELATLNGDGHTLAGKGGAALAQLSSSGLWCDKSALKPVNLNGEPITPVKSTFDAPVSLEQQASIDDYLNHNITSVYQLSAEGEAHTGLIEELKKGTIYTFPFSYRGGLEASTAFLLLGGDGNPFLAIGQEATLEFVGLKQVAAVTEEETEAEEDDMLEFGFE
jgi:hypothetical protein